MKHLVAIMLICSLGLVGCGGDTAPPPKPDTPGEVVEKFAFAMQAGDADQMKELCPDLADNLDDEQLDDLTRRLATNALSNGGISTITIEEETIDGDKASVTAKLTNGNGLTDTTGFQLKQQDDQWVIDQWVIDQRVIDLSSALSQLGSDNADTTEEPGDDEPAE